MRSGEGRATIQALVAFGAAALALWTLMLMGWRFMSGFVLDIGGSINHPTPRYGRFLALWMVFGSVAAVSTAYGLVRLAGRRSVSPWFPALELEASWHEDRQARRRAALWIGIGIVLGVALPALLRLFVLHGMPLTDDEAAYRFGAQLLASGRLAVDSPPLKLFFDNRFLVNDGRLYPAYFLGWPALEAPGVWLGATGFMNALYAGLVVPPLFLVLRRLLGEGWAVVGSGLYLVSPMLMVGAATELSHTTCVMALAWLTWLVVVSGDDEARWWSHAGVAGAFALAFFIRPSSAVAVGGPLLVWWGWGVLHRDRAPRRQAVLAFLPPAVLAAALFLLVNWLLNGSPWLTGYGRATAYALENQGRFAQLAPTLPPTLGERLEHALAVMGAALFRLNTDLFGWPFSLLFVPFARRVGVWAVLLAGAIGDLLVHAWLLPDVGIDSFAPMHVFEMAWPLLLLTVAGLARLTDVGSKLEDSRVAKGRGLGRWPLALAMGFTLSTALVFLPVRLGAIETVARNILLPFDRLERAGLERSVVFAPDPFIEYCRGPGRGWVYSRPNNDPDLRNDPLWVNDLGVEADRLFMLQYPQRRGWVMVWTKSCDVAFLPLDELEPSSPADGVAPEKP